MNNKFLVFTIVLSLFSGVTLLSADSSYNNEIKQENIRLMKENLQLRKSLGQRAVGIPSYSGRILPEQILNNSTDLNRALRSEWRDLADEIAKNNGINSQPLYGITLPQYVGLCAITGVTLSATVVVGTRTTNAAMDWVTGSSNKEAEKKAAEEAEKGVGKKMMDSIWWVVDSGITYFRRNK